MDGAGQMSCYPPQARTDETVSDQMQSLVQVARAAQCEHHGGAPRSHILVLLEVVLSKRIIFCCLCDIYHLFPLLPKEGVLSLRAGNIKAWD